MPITPTTLHNFVARMRAMDSDMETWRTDDENATWGTVIGDHLRSRGPFPLMDLWFAQEAGWTYEGKEGNLWAFDCLLTAPLLPASTNMPHGASGHAVGSPNSQQLAAVPSPTNTVVPSGDLQESQLGMITHAELPPPAHEHLSVQDASLKNYQQSGQPGLVQMDGVSLNVAITISEDQGLAEQVSETP
jgi:hypothetical protein